MDEVPQTLPIHICIYIYIYISLLKTQLGSDIFRESALIFHARLFSLTDFSFVNSNTHLLNEFLCIIVLKFVVHRT